MKFVTLNQAARLYDSIADKLLNKLGLREKAEVSSVQIDDVSDDEVNGSVSVDYDSEEKSVVFNNQDTEELGTVKIKFPTASSRGTEYSVALREDGTQGLQARLVNSEMLATTNGVKRFIYAFPGANQEARNLARGATMGGNVVGGGIVLTSRFRSHEYDEVSPSYDVSEGIPCSVYPSVYTSINYGDITLPSGQQIANGYVFPVELLPPREQLDVEYHLNGEYWIEVVIPKWFSKHNISISFKSNLIGGGQTDLKWAGSVPSWPSLGGNTVQIHVMNNIATWNIVRTTSVAPVFTAAVTAMMTVAGMGPLEAAEGYAEANDYEMFQWILDTTDDQDNHVVKPVWFTGGTDGIFIDALGYHITD